MIINQFIFQMLCAVFFIFISFLNINICLWCVPGYIVPFSLLITKLILITKTLSNMSNFWESLLCSLMFAKFTENLYCISQSLSKATYFIYFQIMYDWKKYWYIIFSCKTKAFTWFPYTKIVFIYLRGSIVPRHLLIIICLL